MENWPAMKQKMAAIIRGKTRDEWDEIFSGADVCYAPVLSMAEVRHHPHHQARATFLDDGDVWQPAPAPRFSRTRGEIRGPAARIGEHTVEILRELGLTQEEIERRLDSGAVESLTP
jgi:alpha-methylacyl-CoA racemase